MFKLISGMNLTEFYGTTNTLHFSQDRNERERVMKEIGVGSIVLSAKVDTQHPNGYEIHQITNTGLIYIFNENSHKLITTLIARPGQIQRYYKPLNKPIPPSIMALAREHQIKNLNNT